MSNVKEVELVKSLRLTPGTVEAVSFTVPRMKVRTLYPWILTLQLKLSFLVDRILPRRYFRPHPKPRKAFNDCRRMARRKEYSSGDRRLAAFGDETS
jgi:hypothetical protein